MVAALTLDPVLASILEQARWAPSGDNTQPWRFEIVGPRRVVVHGFDTRSHCVYDLDGHPSQLSLGALLESMALAASSHGLHMEAQRRTGLPDATPTFELRFVDAPGLIPDPLAAYLLARSVQRRALSTRRLRVDEKAALAASLPPGYSVLWLEGARLRLACARLMFDNARLRLTMPEAHQVHRDVIEWGARFSDTRIPDQALGVDAVTARLMRWIMGSWRRVDFFNTWLAGTLAPRLQMDLLPGWRCGAHCVLLADTPPRHIDDYVAAGRAMQRFWLAATELGLQMQPELTPLIFARYARERRVFSRAPGLHELAQQLAGRTEALLGKDVIERAVFMGRIGAGPPAVARSLRRPLSELLVVPGKGA
ncbi:molybdopterin biosynthesis protein MoeY [Janthinobacterium aquaticum]|nr:molybdopterin biosynthesis protein MoeY [Janthinobacterium sp. FT58W]